MNTNVSVRSEIKQLVAQIEKLAHKVANEIDNGKMTDVLTAANELVKNSTTFTFVLGSLYNAEQQPSTGTKVKNASMVRKNYYNIRDQYGRFLPSSLSKGLIARP